MAPRIYADKPKRHSDRVLKPLSSTDVRTRVTHSHRSARNGTVTQLESVVPHTSPSTRQSPISRGRLLLEATNHLDVPEELEALRATINDRHSDDKYDMRFIPTEWGPTPALQLPGIDSESSPEEVTDIIEQITDYFDLWSSDGLQEGPASLFADMTLINTSLEDVAELPWEVISSPTVSTALRECIDLYESFVETWRKAVLEALVIKLDQLRARVRARITRRLTTIHEIEFASFVSDVAAVSPRFPHQALSGSTDDSIPFLVSEAATQQLLESADKLLFAFQDTTYETETKELWLLIWRSLKVAFAAFVRGGAPTSPTNTLRDRQFFEIPLVRLEMQRLIRSNEASNPRSIEEIVGLYCRYIYQCQIDQENKYESLHRTQETPLGNHTKDALKEFYKTGKFETSTLAKLHFAVARFNKINGGPVKVRRWRAPHDSGIWQTIPLDLDSPVTSQFPPSIWAYGREQQADQSSPPFTPRSPSFEDSIVDRPAKRVFPYPEGINLKSDFNYVWCPFPETRAHEVAQSEQITRELAEPGILSEGPRPDYLINRPPRHTRDSAELARRNFGPFPWIRFVIEQLFAKDRRLPGVKKPNFTGLLSRKRRKSSSVSGSPILGRSARIHKPTVSAQVTGLRGGAGCPSNWLTGPSRRHHFDPTAFHRKMTDLCVREIQGRYGLDTPIDLVEIQQLLPETRYNIQQVGMRYSAPGRGKTAGPIFKAPAQLNETYFYRDTSADRYQRLLSLYSRQDAEPHDRTNNSPRATGGGYDGQDIYDDDDDYDPDQENEEPDQWDRAPLGDLPPGEYPDNRGVRSGGVAPSSPSPEARVRPHCHRCPTFAGQYHHICHDSVYCAGYAEPQPAVPRPVFRQFPDDGLPRDWFTGELLDSPGAANVGPNARPVDDRTRWQDREEEDEDLNNPNAGDGHRPDDPPHQKSKDEDEWTVQEVFSEQVSDFQGTLRNMGEWIPTIEYRFEARNRAWVSDVIQRAALLDAVRQHFVESIRRLTADYLRHVDQNPIEEIVEDQFFRPRARATRRAHPATPELCRRLFQDVQYLHGLLTNFFDFTHPQTNLNFRNAFNALIVAVRELDMVLQEYDEGQENPNFNAGDSDDDDDDEDDEDDDEGDKSRRKPNPPSKSPGRPPGKSPSNKSPSNSHPSSIRTPPLPQTSTPKPTGKPAEKTKTPPNTPEQTSLPGVEAYNRMFVVELIRELEQNRNIDIKKTLDKKNPAKRDYIDLLMKLDKEGNLGRGATEGYRNITGDFNARAAPRGWKLEDEVKKYREQKAKEEGAANAPGSSSSRKGKTGYARSDGSARTEDYGPFLQ